MVAAAEVSVSAVYLHQQVRRPPVLSNLDPLPDDLGTAGAELALSDNLTTAKFLGHTYELTVLTVPEDGNWLDTARRALSQTSFLILDAPAQAQLAVADLPEAADTILLNASARDRDLRHTA